MSRLALGKRWAAALWLGAAACGRDSTRVEPAAAAADAAAPEPSEPGVRVVLGGGRNAFEALGNGERATLIAGPQGAHHVWASFLSYGFDSSVLRMAISTGWEDTPEQRFDMRGEVSARPALDALGVPVRSTLGWPAVVRDPLCSDGRVLRVELTVQDEQERSASDARRWILDVPRELRPPSCDAGSDAGPDAGSDAGPDAAATPR